MDEETGRYKDYGLVITCEHGGNRIPKQYQDLFEMHQGLLNSHRGFDPGALLMAKSLAAAFAAPIAVSTISRLLVDLNRSLGHPRLHFEAIPKAPAQIRQLILKLYYQPYRSQAELLVREKIRLNGSVIHISSHSFTPELNGKIRNADIGLLYDPIRPGEVDLCARWKCALNNCIPELKIRRNYPYEGKGDGLTAYFRQQFPPDIYTGIELEINQKHIIKTGQHWGTLRKVIVKSLRMALSS